MLMLTKIYISLNIKMCILRQCCVLILWVQGNLTYHLCMKICWKRNTQFQNQNHISLMYRICISLKLMFVFTINNSCCLLYCFLWLGFCTVYQECVLFQGERSLSQSNKFLWASVSSEVAFYVTLYGVNYFSFFCVEKWTFW